MEKRFLCLDMGQKRIGIAISDPLGLTAQPKPFVSNNSFVTESLLAIIEKFNITDCYIGLPKDTRSGELTPKALEIKSFGEELKKKISIPIYYIDERFSTVAARGQLHASGINEKKQRLLIDSQAAAFILQGVLDSKI